MKNVEAVWCCFIAQKSNGEVGWMFGLDIMWDFDTRDHGSPTNIQSWTFILNQVILFV